MELDSYSKFIIAFSVLSGVLALVASAVFYAQRSNQRLKARFPLVLWLEVFVASVHAIDVALSYVEYFSETTKCQPSASMVEASEWLVASFFIGRACLFYMQARVNKLIKLSSMEHLDRIVDCIALVTASGNYYRLREILRLEQRQTQSPASVDEESAIASMPKIDLKGYRKFLLGDFRFIVCGVLWFSFGFITSFLYTALIPENYLEVYNGTSTDCWNEYIRPQTSALFLLSGCIAGFFVYAFHNVRDLIGTRNELVTSFTFVTVIRIFNGFNIAIGFADSSQSDIVAVFLYPFIVFSVTTFYLFEFEAFFVKYLNRGSKSEAFPLFTNWKEIERVWLNSQEARDKITKLGQQLYMVESVKFLEATDKFNPENFTDSGFRNVYNLFIRVDARNQINISYKLRCKWETEAKKAGGVSDFEILRATRSEMFILLWPEIAKKLRGEGVKVNTRASSVDVRTSRRVTSGSVGDKGSAKDKGSGRESEGGAGASSPISSDLVSLKTVS